MHNKRVRFLSILCATALVGQSMPVSAEDVTVKEGTYDVAVTAVVNPDYAITIPKSLTLNKEGTVNYNVDVSGTLNDSSTVSVVPDESFFLSTEDGNIATARIQQDKTIWSSSDLESDSATATGTVSVEGELEPDVWSGSFHFDVTLNEGDSSGGTDSVVSIDDVYLDEASISIPDDYTVYVDGLKTKVENGVLLITQSGKHEICVISDTTGKGKAYTVTVIPLEISNGSVVTKLDSNGNLVATITPENGYRLDSVEVDGEDVEITDNGDGTYNIIINGNSISANLNIKVTISYDIPEASDSSWFTFKLNDAGTGYTVTAVTGDGLSSRVLTIPSEHQGLPVVSVGTGSSTGILGSSNTEVREVYLPNTIESIDAYAFYESSVSTVKIPNSVTRIRSSAFSKCSSLTSITIPSSVTSIGGDAFSKCSSLTSVTILDGVTSIGQNAFRDCSSLASIDIPDSVTSIGWCAFRVCSSLTSIIIPSSVTSIEQNAFEGCSSLTSIIIPSSVTRIEDKAFQDCSSLTSIDIPSSVTNIGSYAFSKCSSLTSITIPSSVINIGWHAFEGCNSLTSITIPSSVTSIAESAFRDCSSLTSIDIPTSVTSINKYAFRGCSSLTSITIPSSVTSIGGYAFSDCSSLTSITIPSSVTSIEDEAFADCGTFTLNYKGTKEQWNAVIKYPDWSSSSTPTLVYNYTE